MIPISRPDINHADEEAVVEVLRSGIVAMGPRTEALERAWADYCGVDHAVFMANGTLAMEALLRGLGIGPGDEVITVSFSFNATVSAILRVGAVPVMVDVREDDYCIDPALVTAAVGPRTKAVMPVHLYGQVADMDPLVEIARDNGLLVIEDAAQAIGATYKGRRAGQFGPAMFSLYATKNVMSAEGGMATTADADLAAQLRSLRNHGMRTRYYHDELASNFKPTDLAAALGLSQLSRADQGVDGRRRHAERLTEALSEYHTPGVMPDRGHVWHQYTMRFPGQRDAVAEGLRERGVGTLVYYPVPIHRQHYLAQYVEGLDHLRLPVTERLADEVLSIPIRANLTDDELDQVIAAVRDVADPPSDEPVAHGVA